MLSILLSLPFVQSNRTTVVVAHHLSTIMAADDIAGLLSAKCSRSHCAISLFVKFAATLTLPFQLYVAAKLLNRARTTI